jgi:hypothetical protein
LNCFGLIFCFSSIFGEDFAVRSDFFQNFFLGEMLWFGDTISLVGIGKWF